MSPLARRTVAFLIALVVAAGLVSLSRRAADAPATSDTAVIESYTLLASQGRLLVGAYSRFQWHHPGPLYFYLLAPWYVMSGDKTAGLHAGAAALSVASMALVLSVLARRRPTLAITIAGALALLAWRAAEATASPWNPHVPLVAMAALIVAAADALAGRPAMLPAVAVLASLTGQAHIGLMPSALALGALPFSRALLGATSGRESRVWRQSLLWTAGMLAIAWVLPIYEQITGVPRGNFSELWQFFGHQSRAGQPWGIAMCAWSDMLVGVVRPDFYVAHGWPFVESPVVWAEWLTLGSLAVVTWQTLRGLRGHDSFGASLGTTLLVASAIALWSATRIEEKVFDHDVFWMAAVGALNLAVALECVVSTVSTTFRRVSNSVARPLASGLVVFASASAAWQVNVAVRRSYQPPDDAQIARLLARDLDAFMTREHVARPLVKIDQDAWGVAAGATLELQKRGRMVAFEEDWVVMFTPAFRVDGREDAVLTIAMPAEHLRLAQDGVRLVSSHEPVYAHVQPISAR